MPLTCPNCSADLRIIYRLRYRGFNGPPHSKHIGQPTDPHKVSPVRGPTIWWEESEGQPATGTQALPSFDPLAQPEPEQPAGKPVCTALGRPKGAAQGSAA